MSRKLKALVCIAHPDDEVLFFGGLISAKKNYDWTIVCVTDANADGLGTARFIKFKKSCALLGIKKIVRLGYPDVFSQHLEIERLQQDLEQIAETDNFKFVFTHGPLGEYGHQHHQDVSYAVYKTFSSRAKVYSVAYNIYPDLKISFSAQMFRLKTKILWRIYSGETQNLLGFLPATSFEGFCALQMKEVEEIYAVIKRSKSLNRKNLKAYAWLSDYIEKRSFELKSRPF